MCLLPPNCFFCEHYHHPDDHGEGDCDAFTEIPDDIFVGGHEHRSPVEGDRGIRFELDPMMAEEFSEVEELREEIRQLAD